MDAANSSSKFTGEFTTLATLAVIPPTMVLNNSTHPIKVSALLAFGSLMLCAGIIAIVGNLVVMYTFLSKKQLRKSSANIYTINLAFSNTWLGIFGSVISVNIYKGNYTSPVNCQAEGFFVSTFHISVIMTITCMIADRYHVICSKKTFCKVFHKRPVLVLILLWTYSFAWSAPPLTPFVHDYIAEPLIPSCIFDRFTTSLANQTYIITMCAFVFFVPLLFICYCLVRIYKAVKTSSTLLAKHKGQRHVRSRLRKAEGKFSRQSSEISDGGAMLSSCQVQAANFQESALVSPSPNRKYDKEALNESESKAESRQKTKKQLGLEQSIGENSNLKRVLSVKIRSRESSKRSKGGSFHLKPSLQTVEFQILKSAVLLMVLFVSSWMPFTVAAMISVVAEQVDPYVILVSYLFAKASCVHSSFAYITNAHFRATLGVLRCKKRRSV